MCVININDKCVYSKEQLLNIRNIYTDSKKFNIPKELYCGLKHLDILKPHPTKRGCKGGIRKK